MSTLTYRAATLADIPALITLVTSAYRGDASRAGWTTEADILDGARIDAVGLQADIERERSTVLLAERDGQLVACAHVADDHGKGYFGMFSVDPAQQGGGIAGQDGAQRGQQAAVAFGFGELAGQLGHQGQQGIQQRGRCSHSDIVSCQRDCN